MNLALAIIFTIEVTSELGSGIHVIDCVDEPESVEIYSDDGILLATLESTALFCANSTLNANVTMTPANVDTDVLIESSLFEVDPPLGHAGLRSASSLSVTDLLGDGALIVGLHPSGRAARFQYNGMFPEGLIFAEFFSELMAPAFGSSATSAEWPGGGEFVAVGQLSDISTRIAFSITGSDVASFTSVFEFIDLCPTDIVPDGAVDVLDLVEVIVNWGIEAPGVPADINADGHVDAQDLVEVLVAWGDCES